MENSALSEPGFVFIQMNFWEGRLYYPIIKFLQQEQPHIMAAQEVVSGETIMNPAFMTQESLLQHKFFDQVSEGKSRFSMIRRTGSYVLRCANFTKENARIISTHHVELYRNPDDQSEHETELAGYTGLLHSVVELSHTKKVHVLAHHGRLVHGQRMGHPVADYNFQKIADYIAQLQGPVIFSGDFNLYKEASSLLPLKQIGLQNLNDLYGITAARNEFSWKPEECVSHVFINDLIAVQEYKVATENVSDHAPMVLRFDIKQ